MGQRGDGQSVLRRTAAQRPVAHPGDRGGRARLDGVSGERRRVAANPRSHWRDAPLHDRRSRCRRRDPLPVRGRTVSEDERPPPRGDNPAIYGHPRGGGAAGAFAPHPRYLPVHRGGAAVLPSRGLCALPGDGSGGVGRRPSGGRRERRRPRRRRGRSPDLTLSPGVPGRGVSHHA